MKNETLQIEDPDIDIESLKYFSRLSVEEKLDFLEQLQNFLNQTMPPENKKLWERLRQEGF